MGRTRLDELKILLDKEEKAEIPSQRYIDDLKLSIADLERHYVAQGYQTLIIK